MKKPENMIMSHEFLKLGKRDYENGATIEAIYNTLKYYELTMIERNGQDDNKI